MIDFGIAVTVAMADMALKNSQGALPRMSSLRRIVKQVGQAPANLGIAIRVT